MMVRPYQYTYSFPYIQPSRPHYKPFPSTNHHCPRPTTTRPPPTHQSINNSNLVNDGLRVFACVGGGDCSEPRAVSSSQRFVPPAAAIVCRKKHVNPETFGTQHRKHKFLVLRHLKCFFGFILVSVNGNKW
jgi:hypothetical protein